ncbi:ABC transporter permease [Lentzea tibetensis]|uniref:ABC transporter permease n=1 Tax=Lentzea tibetensis TaxID=2591470 RepID=UPI001C99952E|nr:ABC transporter permease [Lentzea tibetensis]
MKIRSIGLAELLLLWRNRTALFNALVLPFAIILPIASIEFDGDALSHSAFVITSMLGFVMLAPVYYNLVTTFVARREELVLKRLRVGELSDTEILAGTASSAIAIAVAQIVLFIGAGAALLGLPMPVNAPVLLVGVLGGVALFALLAAVSAAYTRTVEMAQITSLPVLMACVIGSGLTVPLSSLPDAVAGALRFLPLTPVMDLLRLGWVGTTGESAPLDFTGVLGSAVTPVALLAVWTVLGAVAVRRWFRWEPRR